MKIRSQKLEILDQPQIQSKQIIDSLDFMVGVNRYLGGTRTILDYFESQQTPDEFLVADLGFGSGDIPYALVKWGERHQKQIRVVGFDINQTCIDYAKAKFNHPQIEYVKKSAFEFHQFESFDYVMSSMFFHHLPQERIIELIELIHTNVRKGFIINDLWRGYLPYLGVGALSMFSFKPVVVHDATLSVARGFKEKDMNVYAKAAGLNNFQVQRKPMFRITLSHHV